MSPASAAVATGELWITAATPWEVRPLAARLDLRPASGGGFQGALGRRRARVFELGIGAAKADAALAAAQAGGERPALLLHTGFAGAVQPDMAPGVLVLDLWGVDTALRDLAKAAAAGAGLDYRIGRIASSPRVLALPAEKAAFGAARRAAAVDMENEAGEAWARERGVPCLAAKAVFDAMEDALPAEAPASDAAGDVIRYVAARWRSLPALIGLARRRRAALRTLERFVKTFCDAYDERF